MISKIEPNIDEIKLKSRSTYRNPNIGNTHQILLRDGPRSYKVATVFEILDPSKGEIHHHSLKIDTYSLTKNGWNDKPDKSLTLEGDESNEIEKLNVFLSAIVKGNLPENNGEYHIIDSISFNKLRDIFVFIQNASSTDRLKIVKEILKSIDTSIDIDSCVNFFEDTNVNILNKLSVATRLISYKSIFKELCNLIQDSNIKEIDVQKFLSKNPWVFGSEYSELLDRRKWTRDDSLDFMLRRTIDNFLEIIEIKTPFLKSLMIYDPSHNCYYPSSKLSQVIGQVMRYIEEIERSRDSIISKDDCDPLKIRARIIIGRDGDKKHQEALRILNSHLHRVEILTFDQLIRIAERTLNIFKSDVKKDINSIYSSSNNEVPF